MALGEILSLTVRFVITLYRVGFIVPYRLAIEVLIGTTFLKLHVIAILFTDRKIRFRNGDVPIVKQLTGGS